MHTPTPTDGAILKAGQDALELSRRTERNHAILAGGTVIAAAAVWWILWVAPYNARLNEIMDCMGDNSSEESYARCAETTR